MLLYAVYCKILKMFVMIFVAKCVEYFIPSSDFFVYIHRLLMLKMLTDIFCPILLEKPGMSDNIS